jgi:hypothetical protein
MPLNWSCHCFSCCFCCRISFYYYTRADCDTAATAAAAATPTTAAAATPTIAAAATPVPDADAATIPVAAAAAAEGQGRI